MRDWQIDETSSRTRQFLDDNRWEGMIHMGDVFDGYNTFNLFIVDLPVTLISNSSTEFEQRFHLENSNKVAFSVRAFGAVELLLCTGWNPRNYPCYYFHIDKQEIYFTKFASLSSDLDYRAAQLEYSKVNFSTRHQN